MDKKVTAYTLLYCAPEEPTVINSKVRNYREKMSECLGNARTLHLSFAEIGIPVVLLTNRADELRRLMPRPERDMPEIREIGFEGDISANIGFYTAYRRWDVHRYLGSLKEDAYAMVLDLDMMVAGGVSESFRFYVEQGIPLVYDITDQMVPAYGNDQLLADLRAVSPACSSVRWYGGEYMSGKPSFFRELHNRVESLKATYFQKAPELRINSDELVNTLAIETLKKDGWRVDDAGTLGVIGRYWNSPCRHHQRSFAHYADFCFLLHLPADKRFLLQVPPCSNHERLARYRRSVMKRRPINLAKSYAKKFLRFNTNVKK